MLSPVTVQQVAALTPEALEALTAAVGSDSIDRDVPAAQLDDPTGLYEGSAAAVVRPLDTAQVQAVIGAARAHALRLVPRGGGTSLAGGAVARGAEVVLDTTRLRHPLLVDPVERTVTAGAGLTLAAVQQQLAPYGLWVPLELGSWQSATIGGLVATNAGGTQVLRHGHVRQLLLGVEAVLGTGEVVRRLAGWRKDNNGPDLSALLCGSEGTLGVVTAATLRVVPLPRAPLLLGVLVPDWSAVVQAALVARDVASVQAVELVSSHALALLRSLPATRAPFPGRDGHLVLIGLAGEHSAADVGTLVERIDAATTEMVMAESASDRAALWSTRHALAEALRRQGRPHKLDLALPLSTMGAFLPAVESLVTNLRPAARAILFGHVADGNVHVNILGASQGDEELLDEVVALAVSHGGHASAEHGIGVAKARWLPLTRSRSELALLDGLRQLCDPDGVLNPRVLGGRNCPA
jgi:FAD/FMN-containing dehydrogenase